MIGQPKPLLKPTQIVISRDENGWVSYKYENVVGEEDAIFLLGRALVDIIKDIRQRQGGPGGGGAGWVSGRN